MVFSLQHVLYKKEQDIKHIHKTELHISVLCEYLFHDVSLSITFFTYRHLSLGLEFGILCDSYMSIIREFCSLLILLQFHIIDEINNINI